MRHRRFIAATLLALAVATPSVAAETFDIPVIATLTGNGAFVGAYMKQNLEAFEADANAHGGVQGRPIRFVFADDQSAPQVAVQLAGEIMARHPTVMLVTGPVAMCAAIAPLAKNGPVMWCLSPALHPEPGSFAFSAAPSNYDGINAVIRYFRMKGRTRLAVLNSTDATGQDADRGIDYDLARPEHVGKIRRVANEHFNPTDVSVAAQIERIKGSGADCLIAWVTGAPLATVLKGMVQAGLDIPVVPSGGSMVFAQLKQYVGFLPKQLLLASTAFPPHDGLVKLDPRVEAVQQEMYAALKAHGVDGDNNTADSWDAALITIEGLRKLGPAASADDLRRWIAGLTDFPGTLGLYDFKRYPERGLGTEDSILVRYEPAGPSWVWVSKLGGAPLD